MLAHVRRTLLRCTVVLPLLLGLPGCGGGSGEGQDGTRLAVVVDTDVASDDILALLFLLRRPDVDVRAITVSGTGEVHCPQGVRHVRSLVSQAGHAPIPVACGRTTPLVGSAEFPPAWRDRADAFSGLADVPGVSDRGDGTATELLRSALRDAPGKVTILALGPLTNLGDALLADPLLVGRIAGVHVMGGALDVPGNTSELEPGSPVPTAEWNLAIDPHAANVVFALGGDVTIVPLDATNRAATSPEFVERLQSAARQPATRTAAALLDANPFIGRTASWFWDPLAAASMVEPALVATAKARVRASERPGADFGRLTRDGSGAAVRVATDADGARFEDVYLATLEGRAVPRGPARSSDVTVTGRTAASCRAEGAAVAAGDVSVTVRAEGEDPLAVVVGRLAPGHTYAEVTELLSGGPVTVPAWFTVEHVLTAPPRSAPTWVLELMPGDRALVCISLDQTTVSAAGPLAVTLS